MGWAYLTQEEAQRTIEPNTLTLRFFSMSTYSILGVSLNLLGHGCINHFYRAGVYLQIQALSNLNL
jgi:hypothetical protein